MTTISPLGTRDVWLLSRAGYPSDLLREDLRKISSINRHDTIYSHREENIQAGRVPWVLTYHPLNEKIKRILLNNFNNDPETGRIFTDAPLVSYRRDRNIRNVLVHTKVRSQSTDPAGTVPCNHPRCPHCTINIKDHFSCHSSNLVYCISLSTVLLSTSGKPVEPSENVSENTSEA